MTNNWKYDDWNQVAVLICRQLNQWMPTAQIANELKDLFAECESESEFFDKARPLVKSHYNRWASLN